MTMPVHDSSAKCTERNHLHYDYFQVNFSRGYINNSAIFKAAIT